MAGACRRALSSVLVTDEERNGPTPPGSGFLRRIGTSYLYRCQRVNDRAVLLRNSSENRGEIGWQTSVDYPAPKESRPGVRSYDVTPGFYLFCDKRDYFVKKNTNFGSCSLTPRKCGQ